MNAVRRFVTIVLALSVFSPIVMNAEANTPEEQLQIEIVNEPMELQVVQQYAGEMTHAVELQIPIPENQYFLLYGNSGMTGPGPRGGPAWDLAAVLGSEAAKSLSPKQKSFLKEAFQPSRVPGPGALPVGSIPMGGSMPAGGRMPGGFGLPMRPDRELFQVVAVTGSGAFYMEQNYEAGKIVYRLLAVSEEDARVMAEAVFQWFTQAASEQVDAIRKLKTEQISNCKKRIATAPRLEKEVADVSASLAEMKKVAYYGTKEATERRMMEYDNLLASAEVELAGVQAKMDAIKKQRDQLSAARDTRESLLTALDNMLVTENIEMVGALARKNAALTGRKGADEFISLSSKLSQLELELERAKAFLPSWQAELEKLTTDLAQIPPELNITGHVIIKPIHATAWSGK